MEPVIPARSRRWRTKHTILVGAAALLAAGGIVLVMRTGVMAALDAAILALREAGPGIFFAAMALLPAAGFPLSAFTLAAGPVFGPTMGSGWVIVCSLAAVLVNLLLTHWLANRALRPLIGRLLDYFEVRLPEAPATGAWQLVLIVRLTPGPPYWLQSYLLGLMRVPLGPYLVVSLSMMAGFIVAVVFGGEAIIHGNGRLAIAAIAVLALSVAILQLLRQRAARRAIVVPVRE
jgi:uncharacterized membrane protein YdjX (TVP38/TMEM64 family)